MRKLRWGVVYCFFCCFIVSCSSTDGNYYLSQEFYSLTDTLRGELLPTPLDSYAGLYYNEYGLFASTRVSNGIFQLLDSVTASKITATGIKGRGPNEFLMEMPMQYEYERNLFSVYDYYKKELFTYKVSLDTILLVRSVDLKQYPRLQRVQYINDSLLVCINFYSGQKVSLINSNAKVIHEQEYTPLRDDRIKTTKKYYNVSMSVSPNRKFTVIADLVFSSVMVFQNSTAKLEMKWHKMLLEPRYDFHSGSQWYRLREQHDMGFRSLWVSDTHIYLSCETTRVTDLMRSAKPKHTYILVMDYEGNVVNKYLLDRYIAGFTLSPDERTLYAVVDNPDYLIAKYKLR